MREREFTSGAMASSGSRSLKLSFTVLVFFAISTIVEAAVTQDAWISYKSPALANFERGTIGICSGKTDEFCSVSNIVDGVYMQKNDTVFRPLNCTSSPSNFDTPAVRIELSDTTTVKRIDVYGIPNFAGISKYKSLNLLARIDGLTVWVGSNELDFNGKGNTLFIKPYKYNKNVVEYPVSVTFSKYIKAKYVWIVVPKIAATMTICEVKVYGKFK